MINILKKDIKLIINKKRILFSILFFVIIYIIFSILFANFMVEKRLLDTVNIGIVDNDKSLLSEMLIDNFENNDNFNSLFKFELNNEEVLLGKYNNNELSAIVYIPKSFTDSLMYYENIPLQITLNPNFPLKNTVLKSIMSSYSNYIKAVDISTYSLYNSLKNNNILKNDLTFINNTFSITMVMTALNRDSIFDHKPLTTFPSSTSKEYFLFSIIILIILFISSSSSNLISDELDNKCLSRYLISGKSLFKFLFSKTFIMAINIYFTIIPFIFILSFIKTDIIFTDYILILSTTFISILFFVSLSFLLGIFLSNKNANMLFSTLFTLFLGILGGNFIPIQLMPRFIQDISSFTPNYWILRTYLSLNTNYKFIYVFIVLLSITIIINLLISVLIKRSFIWEK